MARSTIRSSRCRYDEWYAKDQQVLSFVLGSLGRDVLSQVMSKVTAVDAWAAIEIMFSLQTRARAVNTRLALATTQKGNQSISEFVGKMRALEMRWRQPTDH